MSMDKFVYVFDKHARDILLSRGYTLMKSDDQKCMYIFINNGNMHFSDGEMVFALSDTLTF